MAVATREIDGMTMVYVPAGEFEMGSIEGDNDEEPVHRVALDAFWLDRTEVTNAQFVMFLNDQGNQREDDATWLNLVDDDCLIEHSGGGFRPRNGYAEHPVSEIFWYGAAAYCEWAGGRLPTEAEWEYAARGPQERVYPWGDVFTGKLLNFCDLSCPANWAEESVDDGFELTAPLGSYLEGASWVGTVDLAGNVWEWTADRDRDDPASTTDYYGFRCATSSPVD